MINILLDTLLVDTYTSIVPNPSVLTTLSTWICWQFLFPRVEFSYHSFPVLQILSLHILHTIFHVPDSWNEGQGCFPIAQEYIHGNIQTAGYRIIRSIRERLKKGMEKAPRAICSVLCSYITFSSQPNHQASLKYALSPSGPFSFSRQRPVG